VKIFKHRLFHNWAKSEELADDILWLAINEIEKGLYEANLGGGLYKKRIAISGKGKRSGYRTLVAYKKGEKAFFIYGFSKNTQSNITESELKIYRRLAKDILEMDSTMIKKMVSNGKLVEVKK
jgi:hypothetical protein